MAYAPATNSRILFRTSTFHCELRLYWAHKFHKRYSHALGCRGTVQGKVCWQKMPDLGFCRQMEAHVLWTFSLGVHECTCGPTRRHVFVSNCFFQYIVGSCVFTSAALAAALRIASNTIFGWFQGHLLKMYMYKCTSMNYMYKYIIIYVYLNVICKLLCGVQASLPSYEGRLIAEELPT